MREIEYQLACKTVHQGLVLWMDVLHPLPIYITSQFAVSHFQFNALWLVYLHVFKPFFLIGGSFLI